MAKAARTAERYPPVASTPSTTEPSTTEPSTTEPSIAELNDRLMRAYLSGDGAAVEQVMAEIVAAQHGQPVEVS